METIADVKEWLKAMGEKGVYGGAGARLRGTALEQLASVLGSDEPKDPRWLLENIDGVAKRWANKMKANPGTTNTYLSRARTTLREYLAFQEDPTKSPAARSSSRKNGDKGIKGRLTDGETPPGGAALKIGSLADHQSFLLALSGGRRAQMIVPAVLSSADIRILKKQIELLELQVEGNESA
jgi:hypothetical protein